MTAHYCCSQNYWFMYHTGHWYCSHDITAMLALMFNKLALHHDEHSLIKMTFLTVWNTANLQLAYYENYLHQTDNIARKNDGFKSLIHLVFLIYQKPSFVDTLSFIKFEKKQKNKKQKSLGA